MWTGGHESNSPFDRLVLHDGVGEVCTVGGAVWCEGWLRLVAADFMSTRSVSP